MKEQNCDCNWKVLIRGLRLFLSDASSAFCRAWKKLMAGDMSPGPNDIFEMIALLIMAVLFCSFVLIALMCAAEIIYLLGMASIYLDGSLDLSSTNFIWWQEEDEQAHVMFEAGLPALIKLSLVLGGAICLYKFVIRLCQRGQHGASKMFVD